MDTTACRVRPARRTASARVTTILAALVLSLCATLLPATPAQAADARTAAEIRDRIEYLVNRDRARYGLRRLRVSARIEYYARDHAAAMARSGAIFHDLRFAAEVISGATSCGENVGMTSATDSARHVHSMFMQSAGHRANVLRARWTHMGIGVAKRNGVTYVVERFADAT